MKKRQKSILIVLVAGIGDLVLASKSIRFIRNGYPTADIHLLTSTEASSIARNYGYFTNIWSFPIRELRKNKSHIFNIIRLILKLRDLDFDIVINLYRVTSYLGSAKMALLFLLLKVPLKVGHNDKGFGLFLNKKVPSKTFQNCHLADAMSTIALFAGGVSDHRGIEVSWDRNSIEKWEHLFSKVTSRFSQLRIGINPGGDRRNRRWNPDNYAVVADQLIEQFGTKIILLGGPNEEAVAERIVTKMKHHVINLAGKLMLGDLAYITSRLDLLITNDSGPMHIGAATGTPLVALFGPEDPKIFHPYTSPDKYIVIYKQLDCQPCNKRKCRNHACLNTISVHDVLEAAHDLLSKSKYDENGTKSFYSLKTKNQTKPAKMAGNF